MRICVVSNYGGLANEGMRKVAYYLNKELSLKHDVLHLSLNIRDVISMSLFRKAHNFKPQIIQYVPGPTSTSFWISKGLALSCANAKTVMFALLPTMSQLSLRIFPLLKPDLMLVQSTEFESLFSKLGLVTRLLPLGVDVDEFRPTNAAARLNLRRRYGVDESKFVLLHIGPIVKGRGLELLAELNSPEVQVLIVINSTSRIDKSLYDYLVAAGCLLRHEYFEHIVDVYHLSDCYVFPTPVGSRHAIEIPLSVLEAMSCNLPVITTSFGGLPSILSEGNGLYFATDSGDIRRLLGSVRNGEEVLTRQKVSGYAWSRMIGQLEHHYNELLGQNRA
jgi:glycosyltransferase involved in cell wall biosynthesis